MATSDYEEQLDRIAEYADASVRTLEPARIARLCARFVRAEAVALRALGNRGNAVYTAVGSLIAIGLSGFWAWLLDEPLLFPSLGATAFLFFETPLAEVGTPRNAVIGHFVAILAAVVALAAFGLLGDPSAYVEGVTPARIGAVAVSVALTGGVLRLLRAAHPPAGATTIIVSSGLLAETARSAPSRWACS